VASGCAGIPGICGPHLAALIARARLLPDSAWDRHRAGPSNKAFVFHRGRKACESAISPAWALPDSTELCRLRYVFSTKGGWKLDRNSEVPQRGLGCAAIRSGRRIRDRILLHRRVEQALMPSFYKSWESPAPTYQPADRIAVKRILRRQSLGDHCRDILHRLRRRRRRARRFVLISQISGRAE